MSLNVELKARVRDVERFIERVHTLADADPVELSHEDVFFQAIHGRLKLRIYAPDMGELIYYDRADAEGPKTSHYHVSRTTEPGALRTVLAGSLGVRGVVRKRRRLWRVGQTRVHLDHVEDLGDFMELEVVMREGQSPDDGVRIATQIMADLAIEHQDLIDCAYIDLLEKVAR